MTRHVLLGGGAGADVGFATTCPGRRASCLTRGPTARWSRGEFKACFLWNQLRPSEIVRGSRFLELALMMLLLAVFSAGIMVGSFLAVVVVSTIFEHPTSNALARDH
jgi:hypothetical protein